MLNSTNRSVYPVPTSFFFDVDIQVLNFRSFISTATSCTSLNSDIYLPSSTHVNHLHCDLQAHKWNNCVNCEVAETNTVFFWCHHCQNTWEVWKQLSTSKLKSNVTKIYSLARVQRNILLPIYINIWSVVFSSAGWVIK